MDYIENTLGLKVHYQPWNHTDGLPYYLLFLSLLHVFHFSKQFS